MPYGSLSTVSFILCTSDHTWRAAVVTAPTNICLLNGRARRTQTVPAPLHLSAQLNGQLKKCPSTCLFYISMGMLAARAVRRCHGAKSHKTATDGLWHPKLTREIFIFLLPKPWNESLSVWQSSPRTALESCWRLRQMLAESECWLCLLGSYSHREEFSQSLWS